VLSEFDTRKNIALHILRDKLNITPTEVSRFTIGYCHNVYYVKTEADEYVLRVTRKEDKAYYFGSIKWLSELFRLEISVPQILKHGQHENVYYVLMTYIRGKDLGEVYHTLSDSQKHGIVKELSMIQAKISSLPSIELYGYDNHSFKTWTEYIESSIQRSRKRITQNKIFDADVCDRVSEVMSTLEDYFADIVPVAFLDDITTKNVLIHDGKLAGIVDVDEICYGDPLLVIGLTHMALLAMGADTIYIDYWLDEVRANAVQRKTITFYTLLFCIDFMGEQGMRFDNGNVVSVNQEKAALLKTIYFDLLGRL